MTQAADPIIFSVPRAVISDVSQLSAELVERMHSPLERNSEGTLIRTEAAEFETLVHMAEFGRIASMALQARGAP